MKIKNYFNLNEKENNLFKNFLLKASREKNQPAHVNMSLRNDSHTLYYLLNNTDRFKKGIFNILFDDNKVIACSGCYIPNFSKEIAICGSRTWIDIEFRNMHIARDFLLPAEKKWAINKNMKCILLTFNEYNKNIIELWFRKRLGEKRNLRERKHFGFDNLHTLEFPVSINYTKQWILFELLDKNFSFNWSIYRWKDQ